MLVLTRKIGEQIIVGDNVKLTIVGVGPGRVKIGIEAPPSVAVDRAEVHAKKQADGRVPLPPPKPAPVPRPVPPSAEPGEAAAALHNRIVAKLPPEPMAVPLPAAAASLTHTPPPLGGPSVIRGRLPRKPR